ncbi:MAG TPA: hypothetical protein VJR89_17955 [Polyangiales bacterium]|nr:hypothetical protein [Polyangiales bacterium]
MRVSRSVVGGFAGSPRDGICRWMRVSRSVVGGFADATRDVLTVFPGSISYEKRRLADRGGRRHFLSAAASRLAAHAVAGFAAWRRHTRMFSPEILPGKTSCGLPRPPPLLPLHAALRAVFEVWQRR